MSEQSLTSFRVTCSPSFVLAALTICNSYEMRRVKVMFSAKSVYAVYNMLNTIWRNGNECVHLARIPFRVLQLPCVDDTKPGAGFCTGSIPTSCKPSLFNGFTKG